MNNLKQSATTIIQQIRNFFKTELKSIDDDTIQRRSKIFSNHILYTVFQMTCNRRGYENAVTEMKIRELIDGEVSHKSINKKVLTGIYGEKFSSLTQKFIKKFFYENLNSRRFFGVDGSKINLSSSLGKKGFYLPGRKLYSQGLLSTIYDIDREIPYHYSLGSCTNERIAFYNQLLKVERSNSQKNDVFIFDRGYYSEKMVGKMKALNFDFLFRMKKSSCFVKELEQSQTDDYHTTIHDVPIRIIKYRIAINNSFQNYYLLTNLHEFSVDELKDLYFKRWSVEEYYKKIKNHLKSGTFISVKNQWY